MSENELHRSNQTIKVLKSRELGASSLFLGFARNLKLDHIISSQKVQWRESILAIIIARLLYPTSDFGFPANCYSDTVLWERCGHQTNKKLDLNKYYFKPLERLLLKQDSIQKKLFKNDQKKECLVIYDFPLWNQNSKSQEPIISFLSNLEGCPLGVEFFYDKNPKTIQGQIESLIDRFKVKYLILVGNLNQAFRLNSPAQEITWINEVTDSQAKELIKKNLVIFEKLPQEQCQEFDDPFHKGLRYIVYFNKKQDGKLREDCHILHTNIKRELFAALDILKVYQNLFKINTAFSSAIPFDSSAQIFKPQIRQIFFLHVLSYYLQWHIEKKMNIFFQRKKVEDNFWTLSRVIEKLKTIRLQTIQIENLDPKELKSTLDSEHQEIASIFDVIM